MIVIGFDEYSEAQMYDGGICRWRPEHRRIARRWGYIEFDVRTKKICKSTLFGFDVGDPVEFKVEP